MGTSINVNNEELLATYQEQFKEHKKIRNSYHRQKPEIKNALLFGAGGSLLGAGVANGLLAIASYKKPGTAKGYWGIVNLLGIGVMGMLGILSGSGVGALQKKINPEKYNQAQMLFDKETQILEQINNEIEKLGGERLSYES